MNSMKVVELRDIARSRGLKGWYRLRKSDLISFIISEEQRQQREEQARTRGTSEDKRNNKWNDVGKNAWRKPRRRLKPKRIKNLSRKPDAKQNEKNPNGRRNVEPKLRRLNRTKENNALKTLPERDQAVKRQNPKESNDNGWKDKRSRLRPSAKLMNRHRKRILRKIGRKRSVSTER